MTTCTGQEVSYIEKHMSRPKKSGQAIAWAAWAVPPGMINDILSHCTSDQEQYSVADIYRISEKGVLL